VAAPVFQEKGDRETSLTQKYVCNVWKI